MKTFLLYLPPELKAAANEAAKAQGITLAEYIRQAIQKALEVQNETVHD